VCMGEFRLGIQNATLKEMRGTQKTVGFAENGKLHKNHRALKARLVSTILSHINDKIASASMKVAEKGKSCRLLPRRPRGMLRSMDTKPAPTIRDLYPHLSENELAEAEQILERYLALVLRIFERTDSEADNNSNI
jgi:hypothetical protein